MIRNRAVIVGFLVAPLVSATLGVGQTVFSAGLGAIEFIGLIPIFYLFSLAATILLGAPVYFILNRLNLITWWLTLGVGIIIGAIMAMIFVFPNSVQLKGLIIMSAMGGSSGLTFWFIWYFSSHHETA